MFGQTYLEIAEEMLRDLTLEEIFEVNGITEEEALEALIIAGLVNIENLSR